MISKIVPYTLGGHVYPIAICGRPREAMGRHRRPRDATGGHGMSREAMGGHGRQREVRAPESFREIFEFKTRSMSSAVLS